MARPGKIRFCQQWEHPYAYIRVKPIVEPGNDEKNTSHNIYYIIDIICVIHFANKSGVHTVDHSSVVLNAETVFAID